MVIVTAKIRQWGSSLGIVIPREAVEASGLKIDQKVTIDVKAGSTVAKAFGSRKNWKVNSQKVKDELRKEWSKW